MGLSSPCAGLIAQEGSDAHAFFFTGGLARVFGLAVAFRAAGLRPDRLVLEGAPSRAAMRATASSKVKDWGSAPLGMLAFVASCLT